MLKLPRKRKVMNVVCHQAFTRWVGVIYKVHSKMQHASKHLSKHEKYLWTSRLIKYHIYFNNMFLFQTHSVLHYKHVIIMKIIIRTPFIYCHSPVFISHAKSMQAVQSSVSWNDMHFLSSAGHIWSFSVRAPSGLRMEIYYWSQNSAALKDTHDNRSFCLITITI